MKTAGELLREKRLLKELELKDVAAKIKVKPEYLAALENSDFAKLPSATTTKGFLRNYARFLHLNPDTLVAMFRRDFTENSQGAILPRGLVEPVAKRPRLISANLVLLSTAILAFLFFFAYQLYSLWSLPRLDLLQPLEGDVYGEKVSVRGVTDPQATIRVNDQQVLVDQNGQFTLDLLFPAGTHSVIVEAKNRQGKTRLLERTFQVSK